MLNKSKFIFHVAGQSPFRRRSVFLGRTATEIVDSERIASQVRFFLRPLKNPLEYHLRPQK